MSTPALQDATSKPLDSAWVRAQFPSLRLPVNGQPAAFLDGPAGTQVPRQVMDAIQNYFLTGNANTCGAFASSRANDAMIAGARAAMADFLHCDKDEVVFGQNMTTITFALSRAIGRELQPGDEIVVTTLDHDANVAPWRALEEKDVVIRQVDIREADCTLDLDDLKRKITSKTKLVGQFGYAPLPYKDQVSGTLADWNWAINKDSKNSKAAYLLLAYLTSKAVAHQLAVLDGSISARASLFNAPDLVAKQPWLPAVMEALKNGKTQPLVSQSAQISQIMQRQIALVSSGNASPQSALDLANQQIAQTMNK